MLLLQQSEATAAQRRIPIYLVDATDGFTPEPGLSSGFTIEVSENGAAQASGAGSITEIGEGQYYYEATATELSTLGFLAISIRHANCRDFFAVAQVVSFDPYSATDMGLTDISGIKTKTDGLNFDGNNVLADVMAMNADVVSASAFAQAAADKVWSSATKALTTPNDYKATGFSTHNAAAVWTAGSRALTTPADYKATGFSTHNAAAIWAEAVKVITGGVLTTPNDYKATGFSVHAAADVWSVITRALTDKVDFALTAADKLLIADDVWDEDIEVAHGTDATAGLLLRILGAAISNRANNATLNALLGIADSVGVDLSEQVWAEATRALTTPNDYKATGFSTHAAADIWGVGTKVITGGVLTTPNDYKATGFSTHNAAAIWAEASKIITGGVLTTPADYKATGFSTHVPADIWSVATRQLSGTISDFDELDTALDLAHGAGSWLTGGAGGIDAIINVIPSIPKNIDLSNTKTVRIALYIIDSIDDLPTTAEITPGTITIDRSADGGTSWSNVVNAAACSEHAGAIYYDEVFDSGTGYASADMIRITFKGQKVTISANDYEIADATDGMVFTTRIDSGLSGGGPSAGDIADAVWDEPIADHSNALYFGGKNQKLVPSETIADYKASGFSTHVAADVWSVGTKVITGGVLTTPADYKANVSGLSTHNPAAVWTAGSRALSAPNDYKANVSGLSTFDPTINEVDIGEVKGGAVTGINDFKANVSGLAPANEYNTEFTNLQSDVTNIKTKTDNLPTNTSTELQRILGISDENCYIDNYTKDGSDRMISCRKRIYNSKANAISHGATGLLATYAVTVTYSGADFDTYLMTLE